jgi:hypothetical protein
VVGRGEVAPVNGEGRRQGHDCVLTDDSWVAGTFRAREGARLKSPARRLIRRGYSRTQTAGDIKISVRRPLSPHAVLSPTMAAQVLRHTIEGQGARLYMAHGVRGSEGFNRIRNYRSP